MTPQNTVDRIALYVGGGLVLLGTAGIGLLEMILGSPHPVTGEGQIVHTALVHVHLRSYIILLGLAIWLVYAIFRVTARPPSDTPA